MLIKVSSVDKETRKIIKADNLADLHEKGKNIKKFFF